jgi:hypothetical protein
VRWVMLSELEQLSPNSTTASQVLCTKSLSKTVNKCLLSASMVRMERQPRMSSTTKLRSSSEQVLVSLHGPLSSRTSGICAMVQTHQPVYVVLNLSGSAKIPPPSSGSKSSSPLSRLNLKKPLQDQDLPATSF